MLLGCAVGLQELYVAPDAALFSSLFRASGFPEGCRLSCLLLKPALHTSAAFLVDEKHLHADLLLIKRQENSNWVSPKSKAMVKIIRK